MTHPLDGHVERTAAHIAMMAANPATVEHARLRLRELLAGDPMYADLAAMVKREMEAQRVNH